MKVEEILQLADPQAVIKELKKRPTALPDTKVIRDQIDPTKHEVFNTEKRPDKKVLNESGGFDHYEYVNRISLDFQSLIVNRANSFLFAKPPVLSFDEKNSTVVEIMRVIRKILAKNKELTLNRNVGREIMSSTEVAELWYTVDSPNEEYGFKSNYKLRHMIFSPLNGDNLYPLFDEYGDLIAFSREYTISVEGKDVPMFDVYTATVFRRYKNDGGWKLDTETANVINKIPIVYATQKVTEWSKVQPLIDRLEKLTSNFADTNDYHGSPTIMVEGQLTGFAKKGEAGKILQGENGSRAYYLSWDRAPEAIKLEIEKLENFIYTLTQTPNISFDNIKGLGALSGIALRLMFLDAHLKVEDKKPIIIEYLNRRINVIKAFLAYMNTGWKDKVNEVDVEIDITPYMIDDLKNDIENALLANGNNPVISQRTSIKLANLIPEDSIDDELKAIQDDERQRSMTDIGSPTI